mgnify:FL=1
MKQTQTEYQKEAFTDYPGSHRTRQSLDRFFVGAKQTNSGKVQRTQSGPFLRIPYELLDNPDYLEFMSTKKFRTYMYLQRYIVRGFRHPVAVDIYHEFYVFRKELAASIPLSKIADDLHISKSTVRDHIKALEKDGLIRMDEIAADQSNDGRHHNVYVLGTCHGKTETLFVDEVFGNDYARNRKS